MPNLFDIFKQLEEDKSEKPSEKVWLQLEQKLERSKRRKQKRIKFLQMTSVVLMLMVLLFAAIMVWYFCRK